MAEKLPYMPVWVADIETDEDCMILDAAGFGLYMRLLFRQWIEGSIPAGAEQIARLIRESDETVRLSFGFIESKFPVGPDGRRRNPRCHDEREKVLAKVDTNRANGRKGGRPRKLRAEQDTKQSETERLTEKEPNSLIHVSDSESKYGSSSSEEEKNETNFQANLRGLDNLIGIWKAEKRGGRILARRRLADALARLEGAEGVKEPWLQLAGQMKAYAASDQGRSMYCKSLSGWLEEGGYLQHPREWANDSNQKGSGPALTRPEIERKLAAARTNLSLVPPEADGDGDRAKLQRVVKLWEERLREFGPNEGEAA